MSQTMALPRFGTTIAFAAKQGDNKKRVGLSRADKKKQVSWKCVERCGACCKLDKGPDFASPEDIFDNPQDVQFYKSLIGPDGWCINFEKSTRKCSIYADRPYFCRVDPETFESLYGFHKKKFDKEACNCCTDTIKAIYGYSSEELRRFNLAIRNSDPAEPIL